MCWNIFLSGAFSWRPNGAQIGFLAFSAVVSNVLSSRAGFIVFTILV